MALQAVLPAQEFRALGPTTRRVRQQILEGTYDEPIAPGKSETFGDCPLTHFRAKAIKVLRDRKIRREQRTVVQRIASSSEKRFC